MKKNEGITAHKQKPKSLAKANAICAFAYLQYVMLHALVQFFDLTFVMKNKKNFPNALLII
jgi:hypothetical protein